VTTPTDKIQHAAGGALCAVAVMALALLAPRIGLAWVGVIGGALLGIGYELVQLIRREGQPDPMDAISTAAGAAVVAYGLHFFHLMPELLKG
jgi:hypothetical protein